MYREHGIRLVRGLTVGLITIAIIGCGGTISSRPPASEAITSPSGDAGGQEDSRIPQPIVSIDTAGMPQRADEMVEKLLSSTNLTVQDCHVAEQETGTNSVVRGCLVAYDEYASVPVFFGECEQGEGCAIARAVLVNYLLPHDEDRAVWARTDDIFITAEDRRTVDLVAAELRRPVTLSPTN